MQKPVAPELSELKDVYQFLDQRLRHGYSWSIQQEYPLAFDARNLNNMRIIKNGSEVISHAVLKTNLLKTPHAIFHVGMIGSVTSSPDQQSQQLNSETVRSCLAQAEDMNCDFVILWTDAFDFYRQFGFELAGKEMSLIINQSFQPPALQQPLKIIKGTQIDPQALLRLYNLHTVNTVRQIEDIKKCLQIPNSRVYTAWNTQNQIEAYAIEGKGIDLQGYIHEWGGKTSSLLHLFQHIQQEQQREIIVIAPQHSKNLILQCEKSGAQKYEGILGMFKILNKANLAKKVQRMARQMGMKDFAIQYVDETLYFGTHEGIYKTVSESDMIHLFFGPQKPSEIHDFSPNTAALLDKLLPLPCWIWGWDTI